jgi:hypothetical protein
LQQATVLVLEHRHSPAVGPDAGVINCYAEFFDAGGIGAAVCETPLPNLYEAVGDNCGANTDCVAGLGCWTRPSIVSGVPGPLISTCAAYCDTGVGTDGGTHDCVPPQICTPVGQVQAPGQLVQIGFCQEP